MKKLIVIVILLFIAVGAFIFLLSKNTKPFNPKERNKIVFKTSPMSIQDSIVAILPYLKRMPEYNADWVNYSVSDSNELYLNFKNNGNLKSLLSECDTTFSWLTRPEKKRFLQLAIYLNNNYMFRCDYYKSSNYIEFIYRDFKNAGDYHSDLLRFVTIGKSLQSFDKNRYQILDVKGQLVLYAYKDAKIWEEAK